LPSTPLLSFSPAWLSLLFPKNLNLYS